MLYSPEVPLGAVPPRNFPPAHSPLKFAAAAAAHAAAAALVAPRLGDAVAAAAAGTGNPAGGASARLLGDLAAFAVLVAATFACVSSVYLGRRHPFGSRYGGAGEFRKLLAALPLVHFGFARATFDARNPGSYALGMFLGSHVVFLDNFALLQSFGCKVVLFPSGWKTFTLAEALFGAAGGSVAVSSAVYLGTLQYSHDVWLQTLLTYALVFVGLRLAAWCLGSSYAFHSHHYFNSLLALPLTRFHGTLPALMQGVVVGSFVEGVACWGMDPIFHDPLSRGVDFGVLFWTGCLPMVSTAAWRELQYDLRYVCREAEAIARALPRGAADHAAAAGMPALAALGDAVYARAEGLDADLKHDRDGATAAAGSKDGQNKSSSRRPQLEAFVAKLKDGDRIALLAFGETVTFGLAAGARDLSQQLPAGQRGCVTYDGDDSPSDLAAALQRRLRAHRKQLTEGERDQLLVYKRSLVTSLVGTV